jgi:sulfur carrier protein ThiS
MTRKATLTVNSAPISLDHFVEAFVHHTLDGMVASLAGTGPIRDLSLSIDAEKVEVQLNGKPVPTNAFASRIIRSTVLGMISPLKGVNDPRQIRIELTDSH